MAFRIHFGVPDLWRSTRNHDQERHGGFIGDEMYKLK